MYISKSFWYIFTCLLLLDQTFFCGIRTFTWAVFFVFCFLLNYYGGGSYENSKPFAVYTDTFEQSHIINLDFL